MQNQKAKTFNPVLHAKQENILPGLNEKPEYQKHLTQF